MSCCLDQVTQEDSTQLANKQKGIYSPLGMSPICCKDVVRYMWHFLNSTEEPELISALRFLMVGKTNHFVSFQASTQHAPSTYFLHLKSFIHPAVVIAVHGKE